ncbi:MAG: type II toxin-antitoxin system Phd/YefM family antitoxin [Patescibacteria group bacterium]
MANLASTLPANEARTNFYKLLDEVGDNLRRFVITHRGKARAVVMPIDELESWQETLDVISENPEILKDLSQARKEIKEGKAISLDSLIKKYDL